MPLTLTDQATRKLEAELERKRKRPSDLFRLQENPSGGFGLRLDAARQEDLVLAKKETPLLAIEPELADRLADSALDIGRGPDEPDWVLVRKGTRA
jgi:hypothetical protein